MKYRIVIGLAWAAVLTLAAFGEWSTAIGVALGLIAGRLFR